MIVQALKVVAKVLSLILAYIIIKFNFANLGVQKKVVLAEIGGTFPVGSAQEIKIAKSLKV